MQETNRTDSTLSSARELILLGLMFTLFSLDIGILPYITRTFGYLWLCRGLGKLHDRNKHLSDAYGLSMGMLFWQILAIGISVSPAVRHLQSAPAGHLINLLMIALALLLRNGFRELCSLHGVAAERDPFLWLSVLLLLRIPLALFSLGSGLPALFMIIWMFVLFHSAYRLMEEIDSSVPDAPAPELSPGERRLGKAYLLACLLLACTGIFWNHFRLSHTEQTSHSAEAQAAAEKLAVLGVPEHLLDDLSSGELLRMESAVYAEVKTEAIALSGPGSAERPLLPFTAVYLKTADRTAFVVEYFDLDQISCWWQDGFASYLEPSAEHISGQLLFTLNGAPRTAPIPRLDSETTEIQTFFGPQNAFRVSGAFSFPFTAKNKRGYILYEMSLPEQQGIVSNGFNYCHMDHPFWLPYNRAEDRAAPGLHVPGLQTLQHYTTFETMPPQSPNL